MNDPLFSARVHFPRHLFVLTKCTLLDEYLALNILQFLTPNVKYILELKNHADSAIRDFYTELQGNWKITPRVDCQISSLSILEHIKGESNRLIWNHGLKMLGLMHRTSRTEDSISYFVWKRRIKCFELIQYYYLSPKTVSSTIQPRWFYQILKVQNITSNAIMQEKSKMN